MDMGVWCAVCWVLLGLIKMTNTTNNQTENCIELEFDGLGPSDNMVRIEENTYITLTARIQRPQGCDMNENDTLQIKISQIDNKFHVDVCKFVISRDCNASDTSNASSHCRCLSTHVVQFYKKINRSDSRNYTWTWVNTKKPKTEKRREIFIDLTSRSTEESSVTTAIAASTFAVVAVVAVASGYFLRKRNVLTCCRSCGLSLSGAVADGFGNKQETRQVDDIREVSSSQLDDYSDIKDEDLSYFRDPKYLHPIQPDTGQQVENIYNHLSC